MEEGPNCSNQLAEMAAVVVAVLRAPSEKLKAAPSVLWFPATHRLQASTGVVPLAHQRKVSGLEVAMERHQQTVCHPRRLALLSKSPLEL